MNIEVREPAIAYGKQKFTIEEYLEMENRAVEKHEYYKGEIFAMSRSKVPHNEIAGNLYYAPRKKLQSKKCKRYNTDQRIPHTYRSSTLFTYPDISIVCDGDSYIKQWITTTMLY